MSMSASVHGARMMVARATDGGSWLHIEGEDCHVTIYMPYAAAVKTADAFNNEMAFQMELEKS